MSLTVLLRFHFEHFISPLLLLTCSVYPPRTMFRLYFPNFLPIIISHWFIFQPDFYLHYLAALEVGGSNYMAKLAIVL